MKIISAIGVAGCIDEYLVFVRKLVVSLRNAKIKAREVQKSGVYMSVLEHFLDERNADIGFFLETLFRYNMPDPV